MNRPLLHWVRVFNLSLLLESNKNYRFLQPGFSVSKLVSGNYLSDIGLSRRAGIFIGRNHNHSTYGIY